MALREETVNVGLRVPIFVAVAGVAEEAVVAEAFQIAVFKAELLHQSLVVVDALHLVGDGDCFNLHQEDVKEVVDVGVMVMGHSDFWS